MKRLMSIAIAGLFIGPLAFAEKTYNCGGLRNANGEYLLGAPTYQVTTDADSGVTLVATTGADEGGRFKHVSYAQMNQTGRTVDGPEKYSVGNITVTFVSQIVDRTVMTFVNLDENVRGEMYQAPCN